MRLHLTLPASVAKAVEQLGLFDGHFDPDRKIKGRPGYRQEVRVVNPKDAKPHTRRVWVRIKAEDEKKKDAPEPLPVGERGKERVSRGGKVTTLTGREIPAPPAIRTDTNRKAMRDVRKVEDWLVEQVQAEAEARNDEWGQTLFRGLDPRNLSPADKDAANLYLFGEEAPTWRVEGATDARLDLASEEEPADTSEAYPFLTTRFHFAPTEAAALREAVPSLKLEPGTQGDAYLTLDSTPQAVQAAADAVSAAAGGQTTGPLDRVRENLLARLPVVRRTVKGRRRWERERRTRSRDAAPDRPAVERWKVSNPAAEQPGDPHAQRWLRENPTTVTAWYRGKVDVSDLLALPGARDEHKKIQPGSERVRKLAASMRENGYDLDQPVTVQVMKDGRALLWEGNHRARAAAAAGLYVIPAEVRYEGGSEQKPGVWKPRPLREQEARAAAGDEPAPAGDETPSDERHRRAAERAAREAHAQAIADAAHAHILAGKPLVVATRRRITPLTSTNHLRLRNDRIEIPEGRKWVAVTGETLDHLAQQLGVPPLDLSRFSEARAAEEAEQEAEAERWTAEWRAFLEEHYGSADDPADPFLDDLAAVDYDHDALMASKRREAAGPAHRIPLTDAQVSAIESRMDGGEQVDGLTLDGNALLVSDPTAAHRILTEMSNAEDAQAERDRKAGHTESAGFAGRASRSLTAIAQKVAALIEAGPSVGDTKVENGTTYRFNDNHRWERVDEPEAEPEDPRYKDVGEKIGGARKDLAALRVKYTTTSDNVDLDDLAVLEEDPEAAHEFVTRDRQFGGTRREVAERNRENGMSAGVAYVIDQILRNIPDRPDDTPEARAAFIKATARLEGMFAAWLQDAPTPADAVTALDNLRDAMTGYEMDAGEQAMVTELRERASNAENEINGIYRRLYYAHGRRAANKDFWKRPEVRKWADEKRDAEKASELLRGHAIARALTSPNSARNVLQGLGTKFTDWIGVRIKPVAEEKLERPEHLWLYVGAGKKATASWQQKRDRLTERAREAGPRREFDYEQEQYVEIEDWSWLDKRGGKGGPKKRTRPTWERHVPDTVIREGGEEYTFTDEGFLEAFSLRGVEYGNWMSQDDRREHTQAAGEAFLDLSAVLGVEPGDVSLNGRLALAFGARGRGGRAAAHYERDKKAINLTKYAGGGSLAHEWAHALDNILALASSGGEAHHNSYVSDSEWAPPGLQATPRLRDAFRAVGHAITTAPAPPRIVSASPDDRERYRHDPYGDWPLQHLARLIRNHDGFDVQAHLQAEVDKQIAALAAERAPSYRYDRVGNDMLRLVDFAAREVKQPIEVRVPRHPSRQADSDYLVTANEMGPYWKRPHELFARAFEAFVNDELAERGMRNTYLVAGASEKDAAEWGDSLEAFRKKYPGRKAAPHPRGEDRKRINAAMRDLVAAIRDEEWLAKAADLLDALYGPVLVSSTHERR